MNNATKIALLRGLEDHLHWMATSVAGELVETALDETCGGPDYDDHRQFLRDEIGEFAAILIAKADKLREQQ